MESFRITFEGVMPSFILGAVGFLLFKRKLLQVEGLNSLSRLVIEVTLPLLIFYRLLTQFDFSRFPRWWLLPLVSAAITGLGFVCAGVFAGLIKGRQEKIQFLSLAAFQNSGYLPLVMVASLLSGEKLDLMLTYIFLFLLGFNFLLFSVGEFMLTSSGLKRFDWRSIFSAPVAATLVSLALVFIGCQRFIPHFVIVPARMAGDCTMPLATFVVGANLAAIKLEKIDVRAMSLMVLVKLVLMPAVGLWLAYSLKLGAVAGLLVVMQLAMPPATNLSLILRQHNKKDILVSQGIFIGHVASLVTIPVILSLYFMMNTVR